MSTRTAESSALTLTRAAWGAALVVAPQRVIRATGHRQPPEHAVVVARLLGLRHLGQAAAAADIGTPVTGALSAAVDAIHAVTAAALAAADSSWRRLAALDAALAAGFSVGAWRTRDQ